MAIPIVLALPALAAADTAPVSQDDLRAFVLEVAQRSRVAESAPEQFESRYDFVHTKITEERNLKGHLRKREVERVPNQPAATDTNGPGGSTRDHAESSTASKGAKADKELSRDDFPLDAELLSRFHFTSMGEETVRGRSQRVIWFEPASGPLAVQSFKDKYINQTAGRLWIDAELLMLTRAQIHLRKPVNVWGGILGVVWEFHFALDREQTPEGDWYTRKVQWHLKGRKLFVGKIIDFNEERADVRRVH